jgi:hypothetical protein
MFGNHKYECRLWRRQSLTPEAGFTLQDMSVEMDSTLLRQYCLLSGLTVSYNGEGQAMRIDSRKPRIVYATERRCRTAILACACACLSC